MSTAQAARYRTDLSHGVICHEKTEDLLVQSLTVYSKVLAFIRDRAKYDDGNYSEINRRLCNLTGQDHESGTVSRHTQCYQDTVHTNVCSSARER